MVRSENLKKVKNVEVKCNDHTSTIKSQPKLKYVGIDIDTNLSGESTVNSIVKKSTQDQNLCIERLSIYH